MDPIEDDEFQTKLNSYPNGQSRSPLSGLHSSFNLGEESYDIDEHN